MVENEPELGNMVFSRTLCDTLIVRAPSEEHFWD